MSTRRKPMSRYASDCKLYVGDLGNNASKQELEDAFGYYGTLRNVWVARNPPGFAFVEFEDPRDAEDAVQGLDGRMLCGRRARVELSSTKASGGRGRGGFSRRGNGRPFHPDDRCYECGDRGHYARDCRIRRDKERRGSGRGGRRSRSRSRSRRSSRSYSPKRSRSRSAGARRDESSRSRSPPRSPRKASGGVGNSRRRNSRGSSNNSRENGRRGSSHSDAHSRSRSHDDRRTRSRSKSKLENGN